MIISERVGHTQLVLDALNIVTGTLKPRDFVSHADTTVFRFSTSTPLAVGAKPFASSDPDRAVAELLQRNPQLETRNLKHETRNPEPEA